MTQSEASERKTIQRTYTIDAPAGRRSLPMDHLAKLLAADAKKEKSGEIGDLTVVASKVHVGRGTTVTVRAPLTLKE